MTEVLTPGGLIRLLIFLAGLAVYAAVAWIFLAGAITAGRPVRAALGVWLASPLPMLLVRLCIERAPIGPLRLQAKSFIIGDTIFLPILAACAALMWRHLEPGPRRWFESWKWRLTCIGLGLAAGFWFHFLNDKPVYVRVGAALAWNSPSKLVHDFCAVPVLLSVLLAVALPIVFASDWGFRRGFPRRGIIATATPIVAVAAFAVWVFLMFGYDGVIKPPNPNNLHPSYSWDQASVVGG